MIAKWKARFEELLADAVVQDTALANGTSKKTLAVHRRINSARKKRLGGGGRKLLLTEHLRTQLKLYVDGRREMDLSVSLRGILVEAYRIDPVSVDLVSQIALRSRLYRLIRSWDISYRRCTHKAQNTRHCVLVIADFLDYVNEKMKFLGVSDDDVFNCDQTNCFYSMENTYTYASRGSRTVGLRGAESTARCTVMLGVNRSGTNKLPPYIIFKGVNNATGRIYKELERKENLPDDCEYGVQEKAWMDESQMLLWIKNVWKPFTGARDGKLTYLILDECRTHMTTIVAKAFADCRTEVEYIPGGYTAKLQPMDVGINKPFKNYVRSQFEIWLIANLDNAKPQRKDVAKWISNAWNEIEQRTIVNSWRKAGITTTSNILPPDNIILRNEEDDGEDLRLDGYFTDNEEVE
jgi:hypothetical protein